LTILLVAGLALRVVTQIAYRPSLAYIDSVKYLFGAYRGDDPPGYALLLQPMLLVGNLDLIAASQHLLGLAMAVALYLLLRRRGAARWLAALAVAPILLDAYQLQIEQNVMPDVAFEALIVAGLAALLWRPQPRAWLVVAGGLALPAEPGVDVALRASTPPPMALGFEWLARTPGWRGKVALTLRKTFPSPAFMRAWSPLARRGRMGLGLAYVWRPIWLALHAGPAFLAWRRARKSAV